MYRHHKVSHLVSADQVAQLNVPYILMHMRGNPKTMQQLTQYTDTCLEVGQELQAQADAAITAGIEPWRIILDPGASCRQQCYTDAAGRTLTLMCIMLPGLMCIALACFALNDL